MELKGIFLLMLIISVLFSQATVTVDEEVKNSTSFTLDWYRSSFDGHKNTVVSPISFRILLSLLYQSTIGETERELQNHVYFADKDETSESQLLTLNKLKSNPNIKVVNRIYVKKDGTLKQNLLTKAAQYHSAVEQKDFTKSQQTSNEINEFIEENTNGLIKNLVSPDILNEDTALLLLNTLYFKADWAKQFRHNSVTKNNFKGIDGKEHNIDFMVGSRTFNFYNSTHLKASTIELKYVEESNAKFFIILPNEDSNIDEVKEKLTATSLKDIISKLTLDTNEIWIPTFEIESEVDGVPALKKLGLNSMFKEAEVEALENGNRLTVSDAKQKVKIVVNTQGTEAAAASYVALIVGSSLSVGPVRLPLRVNRPFIYMLLTADTNEPLFVGHYSKPN